jgi:hypothetical protein
MAKDFDSRLDALRLAFERRSAEDRKVADLVAASREAGISWQMIGDALGISRQAAWERYGKRRCEHAAVGICATCWDKPH